MAWITCPNERCGEEFALSDETEAFARAHEGLTLVCPFGHALWPFPAEKVKKPQETAPKPVRGKRVLPITEAEHAASERPPAPVEPTPEPEVAEDVSRGLPSVLDEPEVREVLERPTSTEEPTATAPAQSAEPEPASPASATPASEASPEPQDSSPSSPASDEVIAEGYPAADEVYMLNGDEWTFNPERGEDRRDTYKNGEPFSDAGRGKYAIYEDHAPATSAPESESEGEPHNFPPEFDAYITATETATTWPDVKTALKAFTETGVWKGMNEDQQNSVRANTWATLEERNLNWLPNHLKDITAFRLWLEAQDDGHDIGAALHTLMHDEDYAVKPEAMRKAVEGAAAARIKLLRT